MFMPSGVVAAAAKPLQLSISDPTPSGSDSGFSQCSPSPIPSNSTTVTASGGTAPYSYSWTRTSSADGNAFNVFGGATATASWSAIRCDADIDNTEGWQCTVTDAIGIQKTINASVTLTWSDLN